MRNKYHFYGMQKLYALDAFVIIDYYEKDFEFNPVIYTNEEAAQKEANFDPKRFRVMCLKDYLLEAWVAGKND